MAKKTSWSETVSFEDLLPEILDVEDEFLGFDASQNSFGTEGVEREGMYFVLENSDIVFIRGRGRRFLQ